MEKRISLITGGFDPLHSGHIEYISAAKKVGNLLILGLNSDQWLIRKKGKFFMPLSERLIITRSLQDIDKVIEFNDDDDTACSAIESVKALYPNALVIFCNGGDRTKSNIPELSIYKNDDRVKCMFGLGGEKKTNSSSSILSKWTKT